MCLTIDMCLEQSEVTDSRVKHGYVRRRRECLRCHRRFTTTEMIGTYKILSRKIPENFLRKIERSVSDLLYDVQHYDEEGEA